MNKTLDEIMEIDSQEQTGTDSTFKDFLSFRKMITPTVIKALYWILTLVCIVVGIALMGEYGDEFIVIGLLVIFLGPFFVRMWCEMLILMFQINDSLTDIRRHTLSKK